MAKRTGGNKYGQRGAKDTAGGGTGVEFGVLGEVTAKLDGDAIELGGARPRTVLAALLMRANETVSTGQLCDALWDDRPPAAESNLRTYVARLRREFGSECERLATASGGYRLAVRPGELDLDAFTERAGRGRAALADGDDAEAARCLGEALRLWRGAPLQDLCPGPFLRAEQAALEEDRLLAQEQHVRARLELGRHQELIGELRSLTTAHPLVEQFWELLMLALSRCGRQGDALAAFADARAVLADDLGIEPGPRLQRLQQRILSGDPSLAPAAPVATSGISAHRQIPMDIAEFTGREAELRTLHRHAESATGAPVVVTALEGMAGVGKTRLAVRIAHELAHRGRFNEIQLWADLRGFDPELPPVDPATALERFLGLLGVPRQHLPDGLDERSALFRDRLAGKKSLVLLDNAESASQVRPLLPGAASSFVLVTSRRSLTDLDGAHTIQLSAPNTTDAVAVLSKIIGQERTAAEPDQAARVAELCGRLPIALSLAARQLRKRPQWTLEMLAERLTAAGGRLNRLPGKDTLRATFELSYRALRPEAQRMFRRLGLHYGDEYCIGAAALLSGTGREQAEDLLDELLDENLVYECMPGRYRFHDLIRGYARECAHDAESEAERAAAVHRLLAGYLHTTAAARDACDPHARPVPVDDIDVDRSVVPTFRTKNDGMVWYELERSNLAAGVQTAAEHGHSDITWRFALVLLSFYYLTKHWDDWVATHRLALDATTSAGDREGQAHALNGLGVAYSDLHEWDESISCHRTAEELFTRLGNSRGRGWNQNNIGVVYDTLGQFTKAERCYRDALASFRAVGDHRGEGLALNNLGDVYRQRRKFDEAAEYLHEALAVQDGAGDRQAKRFTLGTLADLLTATGDHDGAITAYRDAVLISQSMDDRYRVASLLCRKADSLAATGNPEAARDTLCEAMTLYTELGDPKAEAIRRRIDGEG